MTRHEFGIVGVSNVSIIMCNDETDEAEVLARCADQDNFAEANMQRNSRNIAMARIRFPDSPRYFPVEKTHAS